MLERLARERHDGIADRHGRSDRLPDAAGHRRGDRRAADRRDRCACAATIARRPAPTPTTARRGSIARPGPTFAQIHVPTSCRHCEHPHCMKDCPPDAIHRAPNGEVFIDDTCIGCGNCERNCPYGVIQLAPVDPRRQRPSLLVVAAVRRRRRAGHGDRSRNDKDARRRRRSSATCARTSPAAPPACAPARPARRSASRPRTSSRCPERGADRPAERHAARARRSASTLDTRRRPCM